MASRIPDIYSRASLRNVTPADPAAADGAGEIGIGFTLADGSTLRLAVPLASAQFLLESLLTYLDDYLRGRKTP